MDILDNINEQDLYMVSFGKPTGDMKKAKIRKLNKGFQLEYIADNKAFHENMNMRETRDKTLLLITNSFKECVVYTKENDISIFRNSKNKLIHKLHKPTKSKADETHDKKKEYAFNDATDIPYFFDLGISDESGNIFQRSNKKFVQINRFEYYAG